MNEVYKVSGMTCDDCANSIKEALELNKYISYVNISLEDENININDLDLKVLKNNTVDIIEYVDNQLDDEEEYKFWELLQIN